MGEKMTNFRFAYSSIDSASPMLGLIFQYFRVESSLVKEGPNLDILKEEQEAIFVL